MPTASQLATEEDAQLLIDYWLEHPEDFYTDALGTKAWPAQVDVLKAVFKYREVAVASCHATGKSYNAARIAAAFLVTHPGSIVVTTAPTWRQVKNVLWRYINAAYEQAKIPMGGSITKTEWEFGADWYAIGISTNDPDSFQGFHADHVLVIVDEAAGIDEPIFEGVRAITTNENSHILYIGNPTSLEGTFYQSFRNPLVKSFHISAFDTPNFVDNGILTLDDLLAIYRPPEGVDPLEHSTTIKLPLPYPALISPTWVYERYLEWGIDSPMWQARVMGEFPSQATNTLIPLNLIEQAMDADFVKEHNWPIEDGAMEWGVDVARFGEDRTVLAPRHGGHVDNLITANRQDTVETVDKILNTIDPFMLNQVIRIDDTGLGGGVTDQMYYRRRLREASGKDQPWLFTIEPINFGSKALQDTKFTNRRAEMYWHLRELFFAHKISLPAKDFELANELASIRYEYTDRDQKIKLEPKEQIKKRTGKSPDKADALALAFAPSTAGVFGDGVDAKPATKEPGVRYDDSAEVAEAGGLINKNF